MSNQLVMNYHYYPITDTDNTILYSIVQLNNETIIAFVNSKFYSIIVEGFKFDPKISYIIELIAPRGINDLVSDLLMKKLIKLKRIHDNLIYASASIRMESLNMIVNLDFNLFSDAELNKKK